MPMSKKHERQYFNMVRTAIEARVPGDKRKAIRRYIAGLSLAEAEYAYIKLEAKADAGRLARKPGADGNMQPPKSVVSELVKAGVRGWA